MKTGLKTYRIFFLIVSLIKISSFSSSDSFITNENGKNFLIIREKLKKHKKSHRKNKIMKNKHRKLKKKVMKELKQFLNKNLVKTKTKTKKDNKPKRKLFGDALGVAAGAAGMGAAAGGMIAGALGSDLEALKQKNTILKTLIDTKTIQSTVENENYYLLSDTQNELSNAVSIMDTVFENINEKLVDRNKQLEKYRDKLGLTLND